MVTVRIAEDVASGRTALDAFSRANYGAPLEFLETIQAVAAGPAEVVRARLESYVRAGARHLVCRIAATDYDSHVDQLQRLAGLLERRA
jgi:hypothetical protein